MSTEAIALKGCYIVKHEKETIQSESDQAETDGHGDDVGDIVTDITKIGHAWDRLLCVEKTIHKKPEVDHSGECLIKAEKEEWLQVVVAHAVADPRAMMIHLEHTAAAIAAVVSALRLPRLALVAKALAAIR